MPLEPARYRGGLVGGIIIDDQMQVEIGQRSAFSGDLGKEALDP
jgi:hypothetical protein